MCARVMLTARGLRGPSGASVTAARGVDAVRALSPTPLGMGLTVQGKAQKKRKPLKSVDVVRQKNL